MAHDNDMVNFGRDAAFLAHLGLHVALVARKNMIDPFFYDVSFNRGGSIGVFTDMDAALAWLKGVVERRIHKSNCGGIIFH